MLATAMGYDLVRGVIRLLLRLFYRRVDVAGAERIPARGPLIVAANHHNSIVDAMLIIGTFPRRITPLANAPLFRHPIMGPFLKLVGAVPVNRRAEAGDDARKNEAMFAAVIAALRAGGAILIFPEGRTTPRPTLLPLRTGAARILLATEAAGGARVTLLPVGLVFERPGTFRAASALVSIGAPVAAADCLAAAATEPEASTRRLTQRLAEAIGLQILEAEDQHTLDLVGALERTWREARGGPTTVGPEASLAWRQAVMQAARALSGRAPERVAEFRHRLEDYRGRLREAGLADSELGRPYTAGVVARWIVTNSLALLITLPLALWGILSHALPYALTARAVPLIGATAEEEATDKMAAGLILYPVCWIAEAWLVRRVAGGMWLVVFLVLLAPSGLIALAWRQRLERAARQARAFVRFVVDRKLHADLVAERRALVDEVAALADLAGVRAS
jgi:glycerol-3-phosphate O-acyltransferase / dihydroxyacetone phosphate acyltransferase